jgi:hypothetical protein
METEPKPPQLIYRPGEAAAMLGMTVAALVTLIRRYRYTYREVRPDGRPGDRGRNRWGLSADDIGAIVRGQARVLPDPAPVPEGPPKASPSSPDGRSRLRRGPRPR